MKGELYANKTRHPRKARAISTSLSQRALVSLRGRLKMSRPPKLCLVCSRGGHLTQLLKLEKVFSQRSHFLITTTGEGQAAESSHFKKIYFITDINEWRWLK